MKRYIKADWEFNSSSDINALKELMHENITHQDDSEVGIFWYDVDNDELFGVKSADVEDVSFYKSSLFDVRVKTCKPLHYKIWDRERRRGKDKRFRGDYTRVPRGRVFYLEDTGFVVVVGSWIKDYPEAKSCILDEFNLPSDTQFKVDSHWDLGHGWSDKFI